MTIRFGIDLDGVLADFTSSVVEIANSIWPNKLPKDYVPTNWGYTDVFSSEDWNTVWEKIKSTVDFWYQEEAILDGVNALLNFDFGCVPEAYFITSRIETAGNSVLTQSSLWLKKYRLRNYNSSVIPVYSGTHKVDICKGLKLPFMLDDYGPTVEKLQEVENLQAFLLDRPWNQEYKNLPRLYSVAEYLEIIKGGSF